MPKQRISGTFVVDPSFDEKAYIQTTIHDCADTVQKKLKQIGLIPDDMMQCLCMFSMIDCFAQEWAGYPSRGVTGAFCDFVLHFQNQFDFLEKIEPVTLYYRVEKIIESHPFLPGMEPELDIDIEEYITPDAFRYMLDSEFCEILLNYIAQRCDEQTVKRLKKEHTVIRLIYQMRNKTVHELSGLGIENKWEKGTGKTIPYYRDSARIYVSNGNFVSDNVNELIFPVPFIRTLTENCIHNYLDDCYEKCRYPFKQEGSFRNMTLCWYDSLIEKND